jgi:hypothetical protein
MNNQYEYIVTEGNNEVFVGDVNGAAKFLCVSKSNVYRACTVQKNQLIRGRYDVKRLKLKVYDDDFKNALKPLLDSYYSGKIDLDELIYEIKLCF